MLPFPPLPRGVLIGTPHGSAGWDAVTPAIDNRLAERRDAAVPPLPRGVLIGTLHGTDCRNTWNGLC